MQYEFIPRSPKQNGKYWYGHQFSTYSTNLDGYELSLFLDESFGIRGDRWRLSNFVGVKVRFRNRIDAIQFGLMWNERVPNKSFLDFDVSSLYAHQILMSNFMSGPHPTYSPLRIIQMKGRGTRSSGGVGFNYSSINLEIEEPKPFWHKDQIDGNILTTTQLMERLKNEDH